MEKLILISFLLLFCFFASCNLDKDDGYWVICPPGSTYLFLEVKYPDSATAYSFDSLKVFLELEEGVDKDISVIKDYKSAQFKYYREEGVYPIVSDTLIQILNDEIEIKKTDSLLANVRVVGYKQNKTVLNKNMDVFLRGGHVFVPEDSLSIIIPH
ncbi:MAG: hypothetical protein QM660_10045 [Dysgonomonas sp.]